MVIISGSMNEKMKTISLQVLSAFHHKIPLQQNKNIS